MSPIPCLRAFLVLSLLAFSAFAQEEVDLSGRVTGPDGAPLEDARVRLVSRGLEARTAADGRFTLKSVATRLAPPSRAPWRVGGARLVVAPEGLRILAGDGRAWHGLDGRRLPDAPGRALAGVAPGLEPGLDPGLGKSAASAPETLVVLAVGFERAVRALAAPTGTQDFRLAGLKWAQVPYRPATDPACNRCVLDVRRPAAARPGAGWPVIVHFHGGGMVGGDRNEPFGTQYANFGQKYLDRGLLVVTPGYSFASGETTVWPRYLRDAAQAAAWVLRNIEAYGGDPRNVFLSGFSAGAYLTHMLSLDTAWLREAGTRPEAFAGFVSMSGQTRTHDNIRKDLRVSDIMAQRPEAMPMGRLRRTSHPWQIFVGSLEGGTVGSNRDLYEALAARGSADLRFDIIPGVDHTCADMGAGSSVKRDKLFAFIDRYRRP